ncbi:DUF1259 domain-containing protein [Salegentibacter sp. JZCK2]|uniref:DUF1259 domain-containing protein n=1 Tax=Salegentibacter tibetensis TaxID=2873600 RepID=UPI001CC97692|nr:DUF1259 domain-containing protein [Salegentibacter tibetensis]MBZ9731580.1 DUF1259 domain-containing protein [Salegentibacter tibetensis]
MSKSLYCLFLAFSVFILGCADTEKKFDLAAANQETTQDTTLNKIDIELLKKELGMEGQENDGEFKVTVPQNDLNVSVDGFKIIPPMGLGSWAAFAPGSEQVMLMGDIVVTESDLKPVQQEIIKQGLTITAIHNHFVRNEPDVMYMHIGGMGDEKKLGRSVKAVFDKVSEIRGANPADVESSSVENTLNTEMIDSIIGYQGKMNNGVYKLTIGRPDVELQEHGAPVSTFLGFNTWASWQGTTEKAAVAGDFTMLADEVAPVIKALVENNIEVVAVHNHMVHEEPRIFFLHYWGVGPAEELAKGLKAALDQTGN